MRPLFLYSEKYSFLNKRQAADRATKQLKTALEALHVEVMKEIVETVAETGLWCKRLHLFVPVP